MLECEPGCVGDDCPVCEAVVAHASSQFQYPVRDLMGLFVPGDEHSWEAEIQWLWENHTAKLLGLMQDVMLNGFLEPVVLGDDGRLWDGHHRVLVALALNLDTVPAIRSTDL